MTDVEHFYDEYVDKVYKFFYIKSFNKQLAEDLTSQTFLLFVEQVRNQTVIEDRKKYLYGIMRNTWLQFLRGRYQEALTHIENVEDFEDYAVSQVNDFEQTEHHNRVLPFVEQLPEKQRAIFRMRMLEQKTNRQIATEIGKDINHVKTTYRRAINSLREMLKTPYIFEKEGVS